MPLSRVDVPRGFFSEKDGDTFAGLVVNPRHSRCATQDSDEKIYVLIRKHVFTNVNWIFTNWILASLPFLLAGFSVYLSFSLTSYIPVVYTLVILMMYYAYLFTSSLVKFTEWYYNVVLITNKRLIVYTFKPLTGYRVAETNLQNIQDVSGTQVGVFPTFFNYGNIFIQTASQRSKFEISSLPRHTWLRNILVDLSRLAGDPEP